MGWKAQRLLAITSCRKWGWHSLANRALRFTSNRLGDLRVVLWLRPIGLPWGELMMNGIGEPADAAIEQHIRESFAKQGLMAHLGAKIYEIRHGVVAIRMPFRQELTQQHRYFHAGGLAAIADSAGGYAGLTLFHEGKNVLTVELKLNLLNPAKGDFVEAIGRVIQSGRTLTICQMDVFSVVGEEQTHAAIGQQTLICI